MIHRIFSHRLFTLSVIVIAALIAAAALSFSGSGPVDASRNEDAARNYVGTIIGRMRTGDFGSLSDEMIHTDSGSDPIFRDRKSVG